uniref:Uncharacterized protein n=1 Tax=Nelumbo nucifera TaxID=4432 RepID=A0A822XRU5_NELNU|nr:TPA_asm: hypothetical protein HUJ06_024500 [Nelumbo nucifera]
MNHIIEEEDSQEAIGLLDWKNTLVYQILTQRSVNHRGIRNMLTQLWTDKGGVQVSDPIDGKFLNHFQQNLGNEGIHRSQPVVFYEPDDFVQKIYGRTEHPRD